MQISILKYSHFDPSNYLTRSLFYLPLTHSFSRALKSSFIQWFRGRAILHSWEVLSRAHPVLLKYSFYMFIWIHINRVWQEVDCVVSFHVLHFFFPSISSSFVDHHVVLSILGHKKHDFFFPPSDQILKLTNWIWWQSSSIWHWSKWLGTCRF